MVGRLVARQISRRTVVAGLLTAAAAIPLAHAATPPRAATLSAKDAQDVTRIQNYLNGIRTMQARFEQVADDGGVANGTIYLDRPGRMRIVYDPPVPILIVATSGQVYYYDSKLDQVSRTTIDTTPAWFLLRDPIKLGGDVTVLSFNHAADALRLTMAETGNADLGQVTLVLSDQPLQLRQWTVLDAQKKKVTVTLSDAQFGLVLNPNLFYWTDPH